VLDGDHVLMLPSLIPCPLPAQAIELKGYHLNWPKAAPLNVLNPDKIPNSQKFFNDVFWKPSLYFILKGLFKFISFLDQVGRLTPK
jgi:hypothetical protein